VPLPHYWAHCEQYWFALHGEGSAIWYNIYDIAKASPSWLAPPIDIWLLVYASIGLIAATSSGWCSATDWWYSSSPMFTPAHESSNASSVLLGGPSWCPMGRSINGNSFDSLSGSCAILVMAFNTCTMFSVAFLALPSLDVICTLHRKCNSPSIIASSSSVATPCLLLDWMCVRRVFRFWGEVALLLRAWAASAVCRWIPVLPSCVGSRISPAWFSHWLEAVCILVLYLDLVLPSWKLAIHCGSILLRQFVYLWNRLSWNPGSPAHPQFFTGALSPLASCIDCSATDTNALESLGVVMKTQYCSEMKSYMSPIRSVFLSGFCWVNNTGVCWACLICGCIMSAVATLAPRLRGATVWLIIAVSIWAPVLLPAPSL